MNTKPGRTSALIPAAAVCFAALSQTAGATVLTFDSLGECTIACTSYSESGYTFDLWGAEGPTNLHLGDGTFVPGTLNWHGTGGGFNAFLTLTLTRDDGGLFDLVALDVDVSPVEIDGIHFGPAILSIFSPQYGERLIEESVNHYALNFFGVSEVVFRHLRGAGVGIDNVLVEPVRISEPWSLSLVGFGLVAAAAFARRPARSRLAGTKP